MQLCDPMQPVSKIAFVAMKRARCKNGILQRALSVSFAMWLQQFCPPVPGTGGLLRGGKKKRRETGEEADQRTFSRSAPAWMLPVARGSTAV